MSTPPHIPIWLEPDPQPTRRIHLRRATADVIALAVRGTSFLPVDNLKEGGLHLLLVLREDNKDGVPESVDFSGHLTSPGGHLEPHQDGRTAAACELTQEASLIRNPTQLHPVVTLSRPDRGGWPAKRHVCQVFWTAVTDNADYQSVQSGDDAVGYQWVAVKDLHWRWSKRDRRMHAYVGEPLPWGTDPADHLENRLAFDVATMILCTLKKVHQQVGNPAMLLEFLPPRFSLDDYVNAYRMITLRGIAHKSVREMLELNPALTQWQEQESVYEKTKWAQVAATTSDVVGELFPIGFFERRIRVLCQLEPRSGTPS